MAEMAYRVKADKRRAEGKPVKKRRLSREAQKRARMARQLLPVVMSRQLASAVEGLKAYWGRPQK